MPVIKDLDHDGKITVKDIDQVNVLPKLYWGLGNTFYYKNWDLNVFIYSQLGLKKYNYAYDWADGRELANQTTNQGQIIKRAYNSQTNPDGDLPGIAFRLSNVSLPGKLVAPTSIIRMQASCVSATSHWDIPSTLRTWEYFATT